MGRLLLKFDDAVLREVSLGSRAVTIGRAPDNDIPIDNLAVSNYHARIYTEAGRLVIEDLNSLNGTFVNDQRVERAALHDGDTIVVGKHHIVVDESHDAALPLDAGRKVVVPKVDETMVLDTKQRREMLQLAVDAGERSQLAPSRMRVPPSKCSAAKPTRKSTCSRASSPSSANRKWPPCGCADGSPRTSQRKSTSERMATTSAAPTACPRSMVSPSLALRG